MSKSGINGYAHKSYWNVLVFFAYAGCWLGNPKGEKVWVPGGDPKNVLAAEVVSDSPAKLALALLNVIFTEKAAIAHQHHPDSSSIPTSLVGFTVRLILDLSTNLKLLL